MKLWYILFNASITQTAIYKGNAVKLTLKTVTPT